MEPFDPGRRDALKVSGDLIQCFTGVENLVLNLTAAV